MEEEFDECYECEEYCRDISDLEGQVEGLEEENARLNRENDDLTRELEAAYELIKKSGVIPDTPENQSRFNIGGLRWALLKYEEMK